jgi:hypothetical protein
LIGINYSGIAQASGKLYLYYWDSNASDNTDNFPANVNAVPVPAPFLVLAPGMLGIGTIKRSFIK